MLHFHINNIRVHRHNTIYSYQIFSISSFKFLIRSGPCCTAEIFLVIIIMQKKQFNNFMQGCLFNGLTVGICLFNINIVILKSHQFKLNGEFQLDTFSKLFSTDKKNQYHHLQTPCFYLI